MRKLFFISCLFLLAYSGWRCSDDGVTGLTPYSFPEISNFSEMPDQSANPVTNEGVALGRKLFFDPLLSSDNTISCSSCHLPENSFSEPSTVTPGVGGALGNRNAMTLVNLAWYKAFQWDGREETVRAQNVHPVESVQEMNLPWTVVIERLNESEEYPALFDAAFPNQVISQDLATKALEQFQLTLISYNSPFDKFAREETNLTASQFRGFEIFRTEKGDCFHCHSESNSPELFVTTRLIFTNNGMDTAQSETDFADFGFGETSGNSEDNGTFKIPTLRNLAYTAPYMHDGPIPNIR